MRVYVLSCGKGTMAKKKTWNFRKCPPVLKPTTIKVKKINLFNHLNIWGTQILSFSE